jgi:simple sugar transport system ATP-binding protein
MLVDMLTVAENVVLGDEPVKAGLYDKAGAIKKTRDLADKYQFNIDPTAIVKEVTVATKQKIEILKALLRGAEILVLDEPTAVLTPQETRELFVQLNVLREAGHTIIFISHKLNEVKEPVCFIYRTAERKSNRQRYLTGIYTADAFEHDGWR